MVAEQNMNYMEQKSERKEDQGISVASKAVECGFSHVRGKCCGAGVGRWQIRAHRSIK